MSDRSVANITARELMWDFAKDAHELRRFVQGLPIEAAQYERLVSAIADLDNAQSVDELLRLMMPACVGCIIRA